MVRSFDSESGIRLVEIYDKDELIFSSDQAEFILNLEGRSQPYEIYALAQDNVGNVNPLTFYLSLLVTPEQLTSCPNNCSENGLCTEYFFCQCYDTYTEADCSRNLTQAEILSEPVKFKFGYKMSEIRDHFVFELELDPTFEQASVEIRDFPSQLEIITNMDERETTTPGFIDVFFSDNLTSLEFQVKVPLNYFGTFEIELVIFAERSLDENETISITNRHKLPIRLYSFLPDMEVKVLDEASVCFDSHKNESVEITFEIEQLNSQDEVNIDKTIIYNTFLSLGRIKRQSDNLIAVELISTEVDFDPVNIFFEFEIRFAFRNETMNDDYLTLRKEFVLRACRFVTVVSLSSTTGNDIYPNITMTADYNTTVEIEKEATTTKSPGGLSAGAIVGIVIGCLAVVVLLGFVSLIVFKNMKKKSKMSDETANNYNMGTFGKKEADDPSTSF